MKLIKNLEVSTGHRLPFHEGKCFNIHGHNYKIKVILTNVDPLDSKLGFKIDFKTIKDLIVDYMDHQFLLWKEDPYLEFLKNCSGLKVVDYIPSVENIAKHLKKEIERSLDCKCKLIISETENALCHV